MRRGAAILVSSAAARSQDDSVRVPLAGLAGHPNPTVERLQAAAGGEWRAHGSPALDLEWGRSGGST